MPTRRCFLCYVTVDGSLIPIIKGSGVTVSRWKVVSVNRLSCVIEPVSTLKKSKIGCLRFCLVCLRQQEPCRDYLFPEQPQRLLREVCRL